jgi:hypothetical protein
MYVFISTTFLVKSYLAETELQRTNDFLFTLPANFRVIFHTYVLVI